MNIVHLVGGIDREMDLGVMTNINQLDLNLVRVFVALMETRNTTRAGEKLGLSQSAVSHALHKLRLLCDDILFIRTPTEMRPTPRAEEMAPSLCAAVHHVESAFGPPEFDPHSSKMQFSVALTDYVAATLLPAFLERIRARELTVSIALRSPNAVNFTHELDLGTLHLAIGVFRRVPPRFYREPLARVDNVWVMRGDHPAAAGPLDLETLARYPHLDIRLAERPDEEDLERNVVRSDPARIEALFAERGLSRRVGAVTGHLLAVGPLVARSDQLAFVPAGLARHFARSHGLKSFPSPYETQPMQLALLSHRTLGAHPGVAWLRAQLHELARQEGFEAPPDGEA